ncbi:MAG: shikimate kinase [Alphaproteobacteria bacterium]|nr:shikimate kinase [Alphaproteobacteria bacterium]
MSMSSKAAASAVLDRMIVLVGLMGAGKTTIGRRLAAQLEVPFVDADDEVERAAGCSIKDMFEVHGEAAFREGEKRVIARLLDGPAGVLATGGGAFMNEETRERIREKGISIWLRADLDVLVRRCARRDDRPLLKDGDTRETLENLMGQRYPLYGEANIIVDTGDKPHRTVVDKILDELSAGGYLSANQSDTND